MKAIVVLSGGIDSTTLLHYTKAIGYEVYGISFNYGQKHSKELKYAEYWGKKLCKEWKLIDISFMKEITSSSSLTNPEKEIPESHYTEETQKQTVVPNRNMVFLSIAIAWAEDIKAEKVFYGAHLNDYTIYPDCRKEFVEKLNETSQIGTYNKIKVEAPFINLKKWQIVSLGKKLGVDYNKTWSCYKGEERPCLKCGTCIERTEAFLKANLKDPLLTEEEWRKAVEIYEKSK